MPPPSISTSGMCGAGADFTCQGSGFGNCCGADNTCGHNADHCGTGCQPGFGYCTFVSNDGTCGNNVTCEGSVFGSCCSKFFNCGDGSDFCGKGCHSDLGLCTQPSPTIRVAVSSTSVSTMATPSSSEACTFSPGLGDTTLASTPGPAVFNYSNTTYSFGFLSNAPGSLAYAELNATVDATDSFAFYQVSTSMEPPTIGCATFGYIYHIPSGLCVTANKTQGAYPDFQGSDMKLEPCYSCSVTEGPPQEQLFCTDAYTLDIYLPYQCMLFFEDTTFPNSFYGPTYGPGPVPTASTVLLDGGECIFLLFPLV
ncbi:carbohydrate-binding module family 18 protein [Stipitochalara longipes BDJ]|nr:carbohydrate-binding module family 18 protein [Stipitochalara longipes BDJ]